MSTNDAFSPPNVEARRQAAMDDLAAISKQIHKLFPGHGQLFDQLISDLIMHDGVNNCVLSNGVWK